MVFSLGTGEYYSVLSMVEMHALAIRWVYQVSTLNIRALYVSDIPCLTLPKWDEKNIFAGQNLRES